MVATVLVKEVERSQTRGGNTRFVLRDTDGNEYTTFRPQIGEEAARFEGRRARIDYHEEERNGFHNVYLDAIEAAPDEGQGEHEGTDDTDPDEAAWRTAVDAAPWLLGESEPQKAVPPERFFKKLKPLKDLVAEDIREGADEENEGD